MDSFEYKAGKLYCEGMEVDELAGRFGTPLYIYSKANLTNAFLAIEKAFAPIAPLICYSVKSNGNLGLLKELVRLGAGLDVVSGGELYRALQAGASPDSIVFAGVGKSREEIEQAIRANVRLINVESEVELQRLSEVAGALKKRISVGIRINPDLVDPTTHSKTATGGRTSKFGVPSINVPNLFLKYKDDPFVALHALHVHLGSPIASGQVYVEALRRLQQIMDAIEAGGGRVDILDFGGGFPARYDRSAVVGQIEQIAAAIALELQGLKQRGVGFVVEPGRSISANAGILVAKVEYVKSGWDKKIVVLDAGMNVLIRPTLYGATHFIWPTFWPHYAGVWESADLHRVSGSAPLSEVDIVGPICETGDFFALNRQFPVVDVDQKIAIFACGAYAMSMASQYNSRPRPAEVLVDGPTAKIIRRRESYSDLVQHESTE